MVKKRNSNKGRSKKRKTRKGVFCVSITVMMILIVLLVQSSKLQKKVHILEDREGQITAQIDQEMLRTQEIQDLAAYMKTDEFIEQEAKDKLGLVKKDEIIFRADE